MPKRTRRTVTAILVASCAAMVMVLGLWQQVDDACRGGELERADPLDSCASVPAADVTVDPFVADDDAVAGE